MKHFILILIVCATTRADHPVPEGHSVHGEAFNDGPRQAATLMDGMADIDFPVTTTNKQAQAFFNQGVSQLHGFWNFEAERSFRQALMVDTNLVMAYWGMAMANMENQDRAKKLIDASKDQLDKVSEREKRWLKSLTTYFADLKKTKKDRGKKLVKDLEAIMYHHPDDLEAKAFLVLQVYRNKHDGFEIASYEGINAIADLVLAEKKLHPVHHYRIHLWDYERRERAIDSAAACGQTAPGIAHMWHMPSHIYSGLKRYEDAAWQQEASARVDHKHMMAARIMPDQIHNYTHNNEWLVRNFTYLGDAERATQLARDLIELPRLPKFKKDAGGTDIWKSQGSSFAAGRNRLIRDLPLFERWESLLQMDKDGYLDAAGDLPGETQRLHAVGLAHFALNKPAKAQAMIEQLETHKKALRDARYEAADAAEEKAREDKKKEPEIEKAITAALKAEKKFLEQAKHAIAELRVIDRLAKGETNELKKAIEALRNLPKHRQAQYAMQAGEKDLAIKWAKEAANTDKKEVLPLANGIHLLAQLGEKEEAKKRFEALRKCASHMDLSLAAAKRIAPLAKDYGWPADWRLPAKPADDLGERPALDSLGPIEWIPSPAPQWTLKDKHDKPVKLSDYKGRPVLMIFYLGYSCTHCMQQLTAFAPHADAYRSAGIELVAVSTDDTKGLRRTFDKVQKDLTISFPIVSDEPLEIFKAYRAYDDFEDAPLHGTYLIDGEGRIRWQDIGFEPMMHPEFLLEEAQRLLKIKAPTQQAAK